MFVLKTDNFWFILRQYSSASEHIHSVFAVCLLTVHTSEHHVLGCRVRLCRGICSIVCTGWYANRSQTAQCMSAAPSTHTCIWFACVYRALDSLLKILSEPTLNSFILIFAGYCILLINSSADVAFLEVQKAVPLKFFYKARERNGASLP